MNTIRSQHAEPPVHDALSTRDLEHVPHSTTGPLPDYCPSRPALCDISHAYAGHPLLMCATDGPAVGSPCPDAGGPPINANQWAATVDHELPAPRVAGSAHPIRRTTVSGDSRALYDRYDPERELCCFVLAALPDDNPGDRSRRVTRRPADRIQKA